MKTIDCFIPYTDVETTTKNVEQFKASSIVKDVFLLARDTTLPHISGCNILFIDNLESSATLRQMALVSQADFVAIYSKYTPINMGYKAFERAMTVADDNDASMIYSDFYVIKDGIKEKVQANPYQTGSVRNDFDFGSLRIVRTSLLKACEEEFRNNQWKFAALYELTLFASRQGGIFHLNESLYTEIDTDLRKSGEKQFDYVDPRNQEVQFEMEQVCTEHLRLINAYVSPDDVTDTVVESGTFKYEVSVIIPVKNRAKTIEDAVMSALSQVADFRFNVIVVDNHSDDGTTDIISKLANYDPRVVHIIPERDDLGIGGCWDLAVNDVNCGRFAVQLDSDDLYAREYTLQKIVDTFYKEKCAMVIGSYRMCDLFLKTLPPGTIDHKEWTAENGRNNSLRVNGLGAPRAFYTPLLRRICVPNTCYGEDYALGLAFSRSHKIGRIFEEIYLCRRWGGNSDAALTTEQVNRNNYYKDTLRTIEIAARQKINAFWEGHATQQDADAFFESQMKTWGEVAKRYNDLEAIHTKNLEINGKQVTIQFNSSRIISTGADTNTQAIKHRPCFLCDDNRPDEQVGLAMNERFQLLVNPFPVLKKHFTIALRTHQPQQIRPYFRDMLQIANSLTDMFIFYNGPHCGASAPDHMHFQAGPKEQLNPDGYLSKAIEIRSKDIDEVCQLFNGTYDSMLVREGEYEPRMNVLAWKDNDEYVCVVFPRKQHRPSCYYAEGEKGLLVSPGALDMMGLIITPRAGDFNKITAQDVEDILKECGE